MTEWVRTYERGADYIESIDGIDWGDAPLPGWVHQCSPRTRGLMGLTFVERCACGATRLDHRPRWIGKNETRLAKQQRPPRITVPRWLARILWAAGAQRVDQ